MEPLDLSVRPPRSSYEELDGLMFMPRTIDKLRALLPGGNPGEYIINGKILGMSGYLMQRLGITEEALSAVVAAASDDTEVAAWLRTNADVSQYSAINETLRRLRPKHAEDESFFRDYYAEVLAADPQLEYILDIIEADDRRIFGANA
jgi:Domain of unknown function (DUF5069)